MLVKNFYIHAATCFDSTLMNEVHNDVARGSPTRQLQPHRTGPKLLLKICFGDECFEAKPPKNQPKRKGLTLRQEIVRCRSFLLPVSLALDLCKVHAPSLTRNGISKLIRCPCPLKEDQFNQSEDQQTDHLRNHVQLLGLYQQTWNRPLQYLQADH